MKLLLSIIAIFEALTGVLIIIVPVQVVFLLLGNDPLNATALIIARITGVALFTLAIVCWLSRINAAAPTVLKAMLFYNIAATTILLYAFFSAHLYGTGLFPAVLIHGIISVWIVIRIFSNWKGTT